MMARTLTGQLTGQFPSLTRWMLGIRLRLSGLVAGRHFPRVISPALRLCLLSKTSLLTLGNFIVDLRIFDHIRLPFLPLFLDLPSVPSRCSPNFLIAQIPVCAVHGHGAPAISRASAWGGDVRAPPASSLTQF